MSNNIIMSKKDLKKLIAEMAGCGNLWLLNEAVGVFTFASAQGSMAAAGKEVVALFARSQAGNVIASMNQAVITATTETSWVQLQATANHLCKRFATNNAGNAARATQLVEKLNLASKGGNIQYFVNQSGNVGWRLQQAGSTIQSVGTAGLVGMGSMILGTLMVVGLGIEALVTQGTFKRKIQNAKKIAPKSYIGDDGSFQLFRQDPKESIHSMLTTIDSKKPLGQAVLSAIPYILDVPDTGVPKLRSSAQTPPGVETPANDTHVSNGNVLIELINDGELDGENIIQGYITNFLTPYKKAIRAAKAKLDQEAEKESIGGDEGEDKGEDKGEEKIGSKKEDKLDKYAKGDKVKSAIVKALRSAAKQGGGSFRIESLGKDFTGDYKGFVALYKALKADKNQNPEGGDLSPNQMANAFRETLSKKYDEANQILRSVSGASQSDNINEHTLRATRYSRLKLRY